MGVPLHVPLVRARRTPSYMLDRASKTGDRPELDSQHLACVNDSLHAVFSFTWTRPPVLDTPQGTDYMHVAWT